MADDNRLSAKSGIDTTDFKTGVAAMNRELRVLESGFKASAAALGDWSSDATGLETRIKSLTSQLDIQQKKVSATRTEWERVKAEKGENSKAAQDLEIKLNKETETLNKMSNELSNTEGALQDLQSGADDAGQSMDDLEGSTTSLGDVLAGLGTVVSSAVTVLVAVATAAVAAAGAIAGLVFTASSASNDLVDLSTKTGISTERLEELAYIGDQLGTSQDTITGSLARLTRSMDGATEQADDYATKVAEAKAAGKDWEDIELGDTAQAFATLGVSVTDTSGNLRDNEAVFADLIDALGAVENESQRDALAMSLFGKSAQELNPLIKAGSAEMAKLAEEAHELGAVVDGEDRQALANFKDMLDGMKAGLTGTLTTLAAAFLPGFQQIFGQAQGYVKEFASIVSGADGDLGQIAQGLGGLIGKIIGDVAKQAPEMLNAGLGILQSIIDAIVVNLPTMIPAAIGIITNLLDFIVQNLPTLIEAGLEILIALVQGITQALPTLIPAVVQALLTIVQTLVENLPMLIDAALQLILALAQGLIAAIPILIPAIPVIIEALIAAIVQALPMIVTAAMELVNAMTLGILQNIPLLLTAAGQVLVALATYLYQDGPKMFMAIGKSLIDGMWLGIKNNFGQLVANFKALAGSLITTVKGVFDMHSPSKVGKDIGANFIGSIGLGGDDEAPKLRQMLTRQMLGLAADLSAVSAPQLGVPGMAGVGGGSSIINIGDIIISVPGTNATPQQIAVAAQEGVLSAVRKIGGG